MSRVVSLLIDYRPGGEVAKRVRAKKETKHEALHVAQVILFGK